MKKIALAQMNVEYGNFNRNVLKAKEYLKVAIDSRCDLILFPELWSSGFDLRRSEEHAVENLDLLEQFQQESDYSGITICGSYIEKIQESYFNSFKTLQPHQREITYYKNHLFKLMHEDKYFQPGSGSQPFFSTLGTTGMSICFDLRFPEFFRDLSAQGVETYLLSSHWPLVRIDHWNVLTHARAIENQAFMIAVNSVGQSGKDVYGGSSVVITPDGEVLFRAPFDEENLYMIDIDPGYVEIVRTKFVIQR
jgi:omega-amidase